MDWKTIGFTAAGVLTSAVASLVTEYWLPWVLFVASVCLCMLGYVALIEISKWKRGWRTHAVVSVGVVLFCFAVLRFAFYGGVDVSRSGPPLTVRPEETITVTGTNLPQNHPNQLWAQVRPIEHPEQTLRATIAGISNDSLKITLPDGLTSGENTLMLSGPLTLPFFSNTGSVRFFVLATPVVLSAVPLGGTTASARPGDTVILKGTGFDLRDNGRRNHVFFGSAWAAARAGTKAECRGDEECLVTTVPEDAPIGQLVDVAVAPERSEPASSGHVQLEILGVPVIDEESVEQARGFRQRGQLAGTEIEIKGQGFDPSPIAKGRTQVLIGGRPATLTASSQTSLRIQIPSDITDGHVEVRIRGISATSEKAITLLGLPAIDHFEPQSARAGDEVEIFGSNFDRTNLGVNHVTIGGTTSPVEKARQAEKGLDVLTIRVPKGVTDDEISVVTPASDERAVVRGFQLIPRITRIAPLRGYQGDAVAVSGNGFLPGALVLTANGMKMDLAPARAGRAVNDSEHLTVVIPTGARSGSITVTQGIGQGRTSASAEELIIDRIDDVLTRSESIAEAELSTARGHVTLKTGCSLQKLIIGGDVKDVPPVPVGLCPVDIDVDPAQHLVYTANARSNDISRIDLTEPLMPKALPSISSNGTNPLRIKVLRDGRVFVSTNTGVYERKPNGGFQPTEIQDNVIDMLSDPGEHSWVVIVTSAGQAYIARREVQGFSRITVGANPKAATRVSNKIYVVNYGSNDIAVLDPNSGQPAGKIPLDKAQPTDIAVDQMRSLGLVTQSALGSVGVLNTTMDRRTREVTVGPKPDLVAITENGCLGAVYDAQEKSVWRINLRDTELPAKRIRQLPSTSPVFGRMRFEGPMKAGEYELTLIPVGQGELAESFTLACPH
jgi:YVTN family beta-propeller protein